MPKKIREGNAVKRFHTSPRIVPEIVGHHSANVCAILLRLDPQCRKELLVAALMHDIPEALTGDIPYPLKQKYPAIRAYIEEAEDDFYNDYDLVDCPITLHESILLKLADMVDLILSCFEEYNMGNFYVTRMIDNGTNYLEKMDLPDELRAKALKLIEENM